MKKMKLVALSAVLCLALGMTVNAAGSSAGAVKVSQEPKKVTASVINPETGLTEKREVEAVPVIKEGTTKAADTVVKAKLAEAKVDDKQTEIQTYTMEVSLAEAGTDNVVKLADGSYDVTFQLPTITANSTVVVLHWADGASEPESLPVKVSDGAVTATFKSFSPVEIVVANEPAATNNGDNGNTNNGSGSGNSGSSSNSGNSDSSSSTAVSTATSPKTADSSAVIYVAEAMAVLSLAGAVICRKKSRA